MKYRIALLLLTTYLIAGAEFFLGPADVINIHVLSTTERGPEAEPNISGIYHVSPDGFIDMHLIGPVQVTGMTPVILRQTLQTKLKEYMKYPDVTVNIEQVVNSRILILGEVRYPGVYTLGRETTALDALAMAGGQLISSLLWDVKVVRGNMANPTLININLERAMKQGDLSQNVLLQSGDIVFVPKTFVWRFNEVLGQINPAMNSLITGADAAERLR